MNKQITIAAFQDTLNSKNEADKLLVALQKLMEVKDPKAISEAKGPQPLGAWGGWAL